MAKVATPSQAAAAAAAVSEFSDVRTGKGGGVNKFSRTRPLTRFEREALRQPIEAVYVYNISPIFSWRKDYPGLGMMSLFARKADQKYSDAIVLSKRLVRTFDGGNRIQRLMVETPLELVQDFLVCSPEFPGRPENNLTGYGCFYTVGEPIESLDPAAQQKILDEAELKHVNKLHNLVAQADSFYNSSNMQFAIVEVHRKAALYLGEERDWVARRAKLNPTAECPFCGYENRRGVAKCRNCHETLDVKLYAELQEQVKKGAKEKKAS